MFFGLFFTWSCMTASANILIKGGLWTTTYGQYDESLRPIASLCDVHYIHQMAGRCGYFFRFSKEVNYSTSITALLLILAGVETNPGPSIKIGSLNALSVVRKGPLVQDLINDHHLDALAICESWVVDDDPVVIKSGSAPNGYKVTHVPRPASTTRSRGGGLCFVHRDNIVVKNHPLQKSLKNYTSFECQLVNLCLGHGGMADGITIANVYRPPSSSTSLFYDELSDMFDKIGDVIAGDRFVACGDFNCGGDQPTSISTDLEGVFELHSLHQYVGVPTRHRSSASGSLLDLVVARIGSSRVSQVAVHSSHEVSDHDLVTWSLATRMLPPRKIITYYHRNLKNIDTDLFQGDIRKSALFTDPADSVDGFADQLESTVGDILERHCPLRRRTKFAAARRDSRWLNDEAITAKRERRRLERKWKATKNESDRIRYRKFCREANKKIVGAREEFYKERIHAAASDPRRRWSEIRNVLHMTSSAEVLPPEECQGRCDRFIEYFVGKVRSVKQAVSDKVDSLVGGRMDPLFHDHAHVGPDFAELEPPSIDDVKKILGSIPGKSSNMDAIPTSLLKSCADIFAPLIARLAALSFREGQFPSRFKIASVTPLLKKPGLDSEVPGNYRPISNLNNISKILERLFLRNIIDHVSSSPSFNSSQSAYRKDHSTETALLRLLNDIYCAADRKSRSLLILLDLSAAFDTLDIGTLIRRLEHTFGIVGPALNWIKSYLTNRSQFVRVGGNRSAEVLCEYGVPQGSVLGPLLFTLYIAPVANVITSHGVSHLQYADDTQLYIALDKDESIEILQNCADAVYSWFAQNGLSLNPEKSEAILLGTGARLRREDQIPSVSFAETTVGTRTSVKSLGVTIDSGLTFQ